MAFRAYKQTQGQRETLAILAFLVLLSVALWVLVRCRVVVLHSNDEAVEHDSVQQAKLLDSIRAFEGRIAHYDSLRYKRPGWKLNVDTNERTNSNSLKNYTSERKVFAFDPNTIDSASMVSLGFRPWMARNLMRYRAKGGVVLSSPDLKKIYGIDTALVSQLEPYIKVDSLAAKSSPYQKKSSLADSTHRQSDTIRYQKKEYFVFNLNSADTTLLARLPGIGHSRATAIVVYRQQLGGYVSTDQLLEIRNFPDSIAASLAEYSIIDTTQIKLIAVNKLGVAQLRRHPYINYYQAKAIYDLRWDTSHKGAITLDDFNRISAFTPEQRKRLLPYLDFSH